MLIILGEKYWREILIFFCVTSAAVVLHTIIRFSWIGDSETCVFKTACSFFFKRFLKRFHNLFLATPVFLVGLRRRLPLELQPDDVAHHGQDRVLVVRVPAKRGPTIIQRSMRTFFSLKRFSSNCTHHIFEPALPRTKG